MTKLGQCGNELDALIQGKTRMEAYGTSQEVAHSSRGILGKRKFYSLRRGNGETGHDRLGGQGFTFKGSRSCLPA